MPKRMRVPQTSDLEFTPGMWTIRDDHSSSIRVVDEQEITIATVWQQKYDSARLGRNNARLIAAAPILYKALKQLTQDVQLSSESFDLDIATEVLNMVELPGYEPKINIDEE